MKKFKVLLLVVMFAVVMVSNTSLFSVEKTVKSEKVSKEVKASYTCPMKVCKTFSDKPGKCGKCGMALKKIEKKACCEKKCDAKKAHKKHKHMKKMHKKCDKDCKKDCCSKKVHEKHEHMKKMHKKCDKDCKKECCVKKEVKKKDVKK